MTKPNILLIMTDELRGDCMGFCGHPDVKTPNIDTLFSNGVSFNNAISSCPTCIPARAALHTGLSQLNHKRVGYQDGINWDYKHTMAGELTKRGYQTQACGKMHVHPLRSLQGFMSVDLHDGFLHSYRKSSTPYYEHQNVADDYLYFLKQELGAQADIIDSGLSCNSWVARPWQYEERLHPTNWVTDKSIDFLRKRDRDKPFFLMTSYVRPHAPYDAPQAFFDMYNTKQLRPPFYGDWDNNDFFESQYLKTDNLTGPKDPELIRRQMVGYYACISHVDNQIGRLLQTLEDNNLFDNTIIIFSSDHGEMLSDHKLVRKGMPYKGSISIPLIISYKNSAIFQHFNDSLVEIRDIMPTILDFANIPCPQEVDGVSLKKSTEGKSFSVQREFIHGEHTMPFDLSNHFIVTRKDKYIWYSQTGQELYFDLANDEYETTNQINNISFQSRINYLRDILIKELENRPEGYSNGKALIVGKTPAFYLND